MVIWREARTTENAAHALLAEYFAERAASFPSEQGRYTTVFPSPEQFLQPLGVFLIASLQSARQQAPDLGCGGVRLIAPSPDGAVRFEVKHLYLRPAARGHGHGRMMLAELETRAQAFGAGEIVLDTNVSQAAAAALYTSSGYHEIAPYNSNANATTWLAKELTR